MHAYKDELSKYVSAVDTEALQRLVRRLSLVMQDRDASLVAVTDPEELKRVEKNFAQETLGVDEVEAKDAVQQVAEMMRDVRMKNRVVFYYLVATQLNRLDRI